MQIENGRFYFISNEFIKKYGVLFPAFNVALL